MQTPDFPPVIVPVALPEGPARDAMRDALQVLDEARRHGHPIVLCEALTDAARHLAMMHAYPAAEAFLGEALGCAERLPGATDLRADLLCALAELACNQADLVEAQEDDSRQARHLQRAARDRARRRAHQAASAAGSTTDTTWEVAVLLRASDVLDRGGDHDDAQMMQIHARVLLEIAEARRLDAPVPGAARMAAPQSLM